MNTDEGGHKLWPKIIELWQGSHRLEKYLNLEGFLEKSLEIKSALKSTGKSLKSLEKSLNATILLFSVDLYAAPNIGTTILY